VNLQWWEDAGLHVVPDGSAGDESCRRRDDYEDSIRTMLGRGLALICSLRSSRSKVLEVVLSPFFMDKSSSPLLTVIQRVGHLLLTHHLIPCYRFISCSSLVIHSTTRSSSPPTEQFPALAVATFPFLNPTSATVWLCSNLSPSNMSRSCWSICTLL